jgi:hypothetical protein
VASAHGFYSKLQGAITLQPTDRDVLHGSSKFGLVITFNSALLSCRLNDALETNQTEVVMRQLRHDHSISLLKLRKIMTNLFHNKFSSIAN